MIKQKIQALLAKPYAFIADAFIENSDSRAAGRRASLFSGFFLILCNTLIAGTFFTSLMLAMGADEVYIGYVTMAITICGFAQFIAPMIWERLPRRKPILMAIRMIYHLLNIVVVGIIPLFPVGMQTKLWLFIIVIILLNITNYIATPGYSAWHMQSLPFEKRVNFSTVSNLVITILNILTTFLASTFMDSVEANAFSLGVLTPTLTAILILRGIALLFAAAEVICYAMIPEYPYETDSNSRRVSLLLLPLKNRAFMLTIIIPVFWSLIGAIIGNFFNVYLLDNVHMSYTLISMGGIISTPLIFLMTPIWAAALKRHSWFRALAVALFGYSIAYVLNAFITPDTLYFYILCIVVGNIFAPCINIVHGNLLYMKIPETNRTAYISLYSVLVQIGSLLGNWLGITFVSHSENFSIHLFGFDMCNLQLVNLIAAVLGFILAIYTFIYSIRSENKEAKPHDHEA